MTDLTDTPPSSSARSNIGVTKPLAGMLVAGYVVLVFPKETEESSVFYGTFNTLDEALDWAELLSGIVTVYPIYQPIMNRG